MRSGQTDSRRNLGAGPQLQGIVLDHVCDLHGIHAALCRPHLQSTFYHSCHTVVPGADPDAHRSPAGRPSVSRGAALGYFLELWGTTCECWTYYTNQTPPLFAVLAHGMAAVSFWRGGLLTRALPALVRTKLGLGQA